VLAALLSRATESMAAKTGDTIGGLFCATLGNMTELVMTVGSSPRTGDSTACQMARDRNVRSLSGNTRSRASVRAPSRRRG
jgi:hypothetical protein